MKNEKKSRFDITMTMRMPRNLVKSIKDEAEQLNISPVSVVRMILSRHYLNKVKKED